MFDGLAKIREEAELSQEDLAKIIGVDRSNISKWERGKEIIPLKHLNTYANYFDVSMDYLLNLSKIRNYNRVNHNLDRKIVGMRIRKVRNKYNLTLRELAKVLNTSSSTIYAYEIGKTLILTSFAYQICLKYNLSLDYLCGRIDAVLINV
ncbi:MAG: transcriptional regulator [Bacilli bacterium]|nr:transcriptional regulator [Bacilli bacterium]